MASPAGRDSKTNEKNLSMPQYERPDEPRSLPGSEQCYGVALRLVKAYYRFPRCSRVYGCGKKGVHTPWKACAYGEEKVVLYPNWYVKNTF